MSYIINKTDGSVLTEIVDGTVDQSSTDLTLIGKNASSYGESVNENFIKLLENFANTTAPNNPIEGQLWYDITEARLKIYDGSGFKVSGGTIVSPQIPSSISQGDVWIDSKRKQLYFNDGVSTILAGPMYSEQQGLTGFKVTDIQDVNQNTHTILSLYVGTVLLGIFSNRSFAPNIDGYSLSGWEGAEYNPLKSDYIKGDRVNYRPTAGVPPTLVYELITDTVPTGEVPTNVNYWKQVLINPGFNRGVLGNIKFDITSTSADALVDGNGDLKTVENFLLAADDSSSTGTLTLLKDRPLILGPGTQNEILVSNILFELNSNKLDQNFRIGSLNGDGLKSSIFVNSNAERVGIYTSTPGLGLDPAWKGLDVSGNLRVQGDLLVDGTTTTINSTAISVDDITITLGDTETPTDVLAEGGGIILRGDTDKTFTWTSTVPGWSSSENINLVDGNSYYIDGIAVLESDTLGSTVTRSSLTRLGSLDYIEVGNLYFDGVGQYYPQNTIVAVPQGDDIDIRLLPAGTGSVDVCDAKVANLADPVADTDAVNLQTLYRELKKAPLGLSVNRGVRSDQQVGDEIVALIYDPTDHTDGLCRVWCIDTEDVLTFAVVDVPSVHWELQ